MTRDPEIDSERARDASAKINNAGPGIAADPLHDQWVEKYRPRTIDDLILPPRLSRQLRGLIAASKVPNLLLCGPPGTGKTTVARVVGNAVAPNSVYFINASMDRGIDVVRRQIVDFASTYSFWGGRKLITLDEADSLTLDMQKALRGVTEDYASNCGFILTCNDLEKIIRALHSRCMVIDFTPRADEEGELREQCHKRIRWILEQEKVAYDPDAVAEIVDQHFPDFRRILNELQGRAVLGMIGKAVPDRGLGDQTGDIADEDEVPEPDFPLVPDLPTQLPALWTPPNEGATLLDALTVAFKRHAVLPEGAAEAMALWVLFAHAHDAFRHSPILAVVSPEKRCGKTTVLDILSRLTPGAIPTSNISQAALYRTVDESRPTLLIDEGDTFVSIRSPLRGILNSGHTRATAWVTRMDSGQVRQFSTWSPKVIALIGNLPDTLTDRSIEIPMKRKRPDETVERLRPDCDDYICDLAHRAEVFAAESLERLKAANPIIPAGLHDRAADNWRPLLAIADAAGAHWPGLARRVAVTLSVNIQADESPGVTILGDMQTVFNEREIDRIATADLITALKAREDRPWSEWNDGRPITAPQLAHILRPFGICPKTIRFRRGTAKGYLRSEFEDVFARYLRPAVTP